MRLAAAIAGLSALVLFVSFLRDVLKEDRTDRRKWQATVLLGGILVVLNFAVIGGAWIIESSREDATKQREAEQSASALRLHRSLESLRTDASEAFERLERAIASRQHTFTVGTLDDEAQRVKASLSNLNLTEATKIDSTVLAEKLEEARRAVQRLNDALDARGIHRIPSDQPADVTAEVEGQEHRRREDQKSWPPTATQPLTTGRPVRRESSDATHRPTRQTSSMADAEAPAKAVIGPIVVPGLSITIDQIVRNEQIAGSVTGLTDVGRRNHRVVVYVKTDQWYIHPYAQGGDGKSWASIAGDGSWKIATVKREFPASEVAALLVRADAKPTSPVPNVRDLPHQAISVKPLTNTPNEGDL